MFRPSSSPLALAVLFVGLTATAQAGPPGRSAPRSVVLTGRAGESPPLYLAPGTFTLLLLDAPIVRESVQVEGRSRFAVVDVGDRTITLSPTAELAPTERLALRVTYREGFPASAVFLLTAQPGVVDEVVSVSRPQQTVEACRAELSTLRERCEAQRQELEALKARPPVPSPAAIGLAGLVNEDGIRVKDLLYACHKVLGGLRPAECKRLAASTWTVVVLEVSNTGADTWTPTWAEVTPVEGGAPRRARAVLSNHTSLSPGESARVAVEVEMPTREATEWLTAPHTLRVCNGDGSRCLSIPQVAL